MARQKGQKNINLEKKLGNNYQMNNEPLTSVLEINNLTKKFGGLIAVDAVSFTVKQNEILGLIGPNGAGKTTMFNILSGLIAPDFGQINYLGRALTKLPPYQIAQLGIARTFQNLRLFGNLSALENVVVARHIHHQTGFLPELLGLPKARLAKKTTDTKAKELLELVGLSENIEQPAHNFSYGDQRRLEIARALALEPKILLLDEPAAGMNLREKTSLSNLIRQIREQFNLTIILIEHNIPLVMGLCERIAVLDFGKLIFIGNPEQVKNEPVVIEAYLGNESSIGDDNYKYVRNY